MRGNHKERGKGNITCCNTTVSKGSHGARPADRLLMNILALAQDARAQIGGWKIQRFRYLHSFHHSDGERVKEKHIKNEVKVVSCYFTPRWMSSRAFISIIRRLFFFFFWALRRAFSCMHNLLSHRASFWNLLISSGSRSSGACYSYPPPPPKNTNKQKSQRKKEVRKQTNCFKALQSVDNPKPRDRPCKF